MSLYLFNSIGLMSKLDENEARIKTKKATKRSFVYSDITKKWFKYGCEISLPLWIPVSEHEVPKEYRAQVLLIS